MVFWEEKAFTKKLNVDHTYVLLINHLSVKQKTTHPIYFALITWKFLQILLLHHHHHSATSFSSEREGKIPFTNNNIYGGGKNDENF